MEVNAKLYLFAAKLLQKYGQAKLLGLGEKELQVLFGELHNMLVTEEETQLNKLFLFAKTLYNNKQVATYFENVEVVLSYHERVKNLL